jgi:hypothetical protein
MAMILRRASPDPGIGAPVELRSRDARGLFDLCGIGKTLPGERIAAEEPPPTFLQIEPTRSRRNEDMMDARMPFQPGARLQAGMTTEIITDDEDVAFGIVGFDVVQKRNVAFRVARSGAARQFFPIVHTQRSIHPGLLRSPAIVQWRFDTVAVARPARGRVKGAWDYWSEFVGTDGRRSFGRLGVMDDDRRSFGTKSLSRGSLQLWVLRQRTFSRTRMRRTWLRLTRMPAS